MKDPSNNELEQLLAQALAENERQVGVIRELGTRCQNLTATVQDLGRELDSLRAADHDHYSGVEGARRWLSEHIGYDLRQVAKCPTCLGTRTTPTNPEQIGAEFRCLGCGLVFYIVKVLDTSPQTIRRAIKDAKHDSYCSTVDAKVEPQGPAPGRSLGQLTSGQR